MLGGAVGGVFMAYHSAQGPKLGLTQLTQSRAQFGFFGALLPNFVIWLIFLCSSASSSTRPGPRTST